MTGDRNGERELVKSDEPPLGTREEFQAELHALARDYAPRRFAICEEYGDRVDGWVEAWGMAFAGQILAYQEQTGAITIGGSAEQMLRRFRGRQVQLVWLDPEPLDNPDDPVS